MPNLTNQLYKILKGLSYDTLNQVFSKDDETGEYNINWNVVQNLSDVTNSDKFGDDTKWGGDDSSFDADKLINNAEKLISKVKKKEDREKGKKAILPNGVETDSDIDPFGVESLRTAKTNYSNLKEQAKTDSSITSDVLKGAANRVKLAKTNTTTQAMGAVASVASSFMPDRPEYSGKYGSLSQGLDKVYDGIKDGIAAVPMFGPVASGIMEVGEMAGKVMGAIGGGTDGMTVKDAILGSSFFNMTPIGLINGFGGATTDTITKNEMAFSQVGNSYTGTSNKVDSAVEKSGKKYGLFSKGEFKDAQEEIAEARRLQDKIESIGEEATRRSTLQANMTNTYANRYALNTGGGYLQNISVGRKGIELNLNKARLTLKKYQSGGTITTFAPTTTITSTIIKIPDLSIDTLQEYIEPAYIYPSYLLENKDIMRYLDGGHIKNDDYIRHLVQSILSENKNVRFIQRLLEKPTKWVETPTGYPGSHLLSYVEDDEGNAYVYPEIMEDENGNLKYYGREAINSSKERGDYIKMTPYDAELFTNHYKEYIPEWMELFNELVAPYVGENGKVKLGMQPVPVFLDGGEINVIPDGALHKELHHMENADNLTRKGIPIVGLDGEQIAEIEKAEIILRLDVIKEIEDNYEKYYDDETSKEEKDLLALNIGKMLVNEILYNTLDLTKNIL